MPKLPDVQMVRQYPDATRLHQKVAGKSACFRPVCQEDLAASNRKDPP